MPTTRKRALVRSLGGGRTTLNQGFGDPILTKGTFPPFKGTQITVSEGHRWPPPRGAVGDIGGDFSSRKTFMVVDKTARRVFFKSNPDAFGHVQTTVYEGSVLPYLPQAWVSPPDSGSSNGTLDSWGASAVAQCKPTNSVADLSVFLGELLKDGIPRLAGARTWEDRTLTARNAGDEYLNAQFGWKPLLSDVRKFAYAAAHAGSVLDQFEKDAGKQVRRKFHFPSTTKVETSIVASGTAAVLAAPSSTLFHPTDRGDVVRVRETTQRRWFSGAFTYHLPQGTSPAASMYRHALEARKLLGLSLTPDTLWNLAPWSWAVDWVSNVGDVLSNVSDYLAYGLILRYGYIMEHTTVSDTYVLTKTGLIDPSTRVAPIRVVTETKLRRRANPFGFGITWEGLSPFQLSILSALGLSRS